MLARSLTVLALAVLALHCGGSTPAESSPSDKCVPLDKVRADCPANWDAALAASQTFCSERRDKESFDAFVSTDACRGALRYTRHLFDGGPRYCFYDPTSKALVAAAAFDGKALYEAWSCGRPRSDFDDSGCPGAPCSR